MSKLASDPAVSEPQRKAMCAAAHGRSTLDIPRSVGEEFCGDDFFEAYDQLTKYTATVTYADNSGTKRSDTFPVYASNESNASLNARRAVATRNKGFRDITVSQLSKDAERTDSFNKHGATLGRTDPFSSYDAPRDHREEKLIREINREWREQQKGDPPVGWGANEDKVWALRKKLHDQLGRFPTDQELKVAAKKAGLSYDALEAFRIKHESHGVELMEGYNAEKGQGYGQPTGNWMVATQVGNKTFNNKSAAERYFDQMVVHYKRWSRDDNPFGSYDALSAQEQADTAYQLGIRAGKSGIKDNPFTVPALRAKWEQGRKSIAQDKKPHAAGICFRLPNGDTLYLRRTKKNEDHPDEWDFPGGRMDEGETPEEAAIRETREESGWIKPEGLPDMVEAAKNDGFITFVQQINNPFIPTLDDEHDGYAWAPLDKPPDPVLEEIKEVIPELQATDAMLATTPNAGIPAYAHAPDNEKKEHPEINNNRGEADDDTEEEPFGTKPTERDNEQESAERGGHEMEDHGARDFKQERGFVVRLYGPGNFLAAESPLLISEGAATRWAAEHSRGKNITRTQVGRAFADPSYLRDKAMDEMFRAYDRAHVPLMAFDERPMGMVRERLAFDKSSESVREFDQDGRMRVKTANISKSVINPYRGHEIPGYEELGLEPDKVYQLFRDPKELEKAAPTFNGIQVLMKHIPVSADDHQPWDTVGATGTDATFTEPYLQNSLHIWAQPAIDVIESGDQKELSCAYHYDPDMTPGSYKGQKYDGVMRNIKGNHVALVSEGRAGHDVIVGDSKMKESGMAKKKLLSSTASAAFGAVSLYLKPKLAKDAKLPDLKPLFVSITGKNFAERKAQLVDGIKKQIKSVLAVDASAEGLSKLLDALEEVEVEDAELETTIPGEPKKTEVEIDPEAAEASVKHKAALDNEELKGFLAEKGMDEESIGTVMDMIGAMGSAGDESGEMERAEEGLDEKEEGEEGAEDEPAERSEMAERIKEKSGAKDEPPPFKGRPEVGGKMTGDRKMVSQAAMDAAIKKAVAAAVTEATKKADEANKVAMDKAIKAAADGASKMAKEIRDAENDVRPWVGNLAMAHDSAEGVYRTALGALGVEHDGIHASALKTILHMQPKPGDPRTPAQQAHDDSMAMDASASEGFFKRHPGAAKIDVI